MNKVVLSIIFNLNFSYKKVIIICEASRYYNMFISLKFNCNHLMLKFFVDRITKKFFYTFKFV